MKKHLFAVLLCLFAFNAIANAQKGNLLFGATPYGKLDLDLKMDGVQNTMVFYPVYGVQIGGELGDNARGMLAEVFFMKGTPQGLNSGKESVALVDWSNPATVIGFRGYSLRLLNSRHRIQFPIHFGLGISLVDNSSVQAWTANLAAKARVRFYFTNTIGIYAGATADFGFGLKSSVGEAYTWYRGVDAGLIIGF